VLGDARHARRDDEAVVLGALRGGRAVPRDR
jgi:hypothetical protein